MRVTPDPETCLVITSIGIILGEHDYWLEFYEDACAAFPDAVGPIGENNAIKYLLSKEWDAIAYIENFQTVVRFSNASLKTAFLLQYG